MLLPLWMAVTTPRRRAGRGDQNPETAAAWRRPRETDAADHGDQAGKDSGLQMPRTHSPLSLPCLLPPPGQGSLVAEQGGEGLGCGGGGGGECQHSYHLGSGTVRSFSRKFILATQERMDPSGREGGGGRPDHSKWPQNHFLNLNDPT